MAGGAVRYGGQEWTRRNLASQREAGKFNQLSPPGGRREQKAHARHRERLF